MTTPHAGFDLERFVRAQVPIYATALAELKRGKKQSHWMWFILPQLRGLGQSEMARTYGLQGLAEAQAYQAHALLAPRLNECVEAMLGHAGTLAHAILGGVDALKFRSCLTLFDKAAPDVPIFSEALAVFFEGQPDLETLRLLQEHEAGHRSESS
jgi:uncharacterized protein (DUF1810 family)